MYIYITYLLIKYVILMINIHSIVDDIYIYILYPSAGMVDSASLSFAG